MVHPDQSDWDLFVPYATFAVNTARHESIGTTPFFLMHGREPRTLVEDLFGAGSTGLAMHDWYQRLVHARERAAALDGVARAPPAGVRKNEELKVGDLVMIRFEGTRKGKSKKLMPRQQGPYRVTAIKDGVTVTAENVANPKDVRERHISHLRRFYGEPHGVVAEDHWEIDAIREERRRRGQLEYLVHFRGFGEDHNEWKRAADVTAPELMEAWEAQKAKDNVKPIDDPKINVARVVDAKWVGRVQKYLVAESEGMGPDDYIWVTEKEVENPELLRGYASGGGVVGTRSRKSTSRE